MKISLKIGIFLSVILVVALAKRCQEAEVEQLPPPDAGHDVPEAVDLGQDTSPPTWIIAEPQAGSFVALLDGEPTEGVFTIGAAGVYPPLQTRGAGISLPTPAATMAGEAVMVLEIYAHTPDSKRVAWADVHVDENAIELEPAASVAVRVVDESGASVEGARVRLGRDAIGLVLLHADTDADGQAEVSPVPAGEYVVTVEVAGALTQTTEVSTGSEATIVARRGRDVQGTVRDAEGRPVANAIVAIFASGSGANPVDDVPTDIAATDDKGRYEARGVDGSQFVAVAIADGAAPTRATAQAPPIGHVELDVTLRRGHQLLVHVLSESGSPVSGAKVEWVDGDTQAGAAMLSDSAGNARFVGVPSSAGVRASHGRFESSTVSVNALPGSVYEVELRLTTEDKRMWRYRVHTPDSVVLKNLEVSDGAGARCSVETMDGRDFIVRACGEGDARFEATTNHGVVEWEAPFEDGASVEMPKPVPVRIGVTGHPEEAWTHTMFDLTGLGPTSAEVEQIRTSDGARIEASLYPGRWRFTVSNTRIGSLPFAFDVLDEPFETAVELVSLQRFRVEVVDAYGGPVTGAYAMLFSDDGVLVDVGRTAGQLPTEFRVRPPFDGTVLVVDPRRGEGRAGLSTSGSDGPLRVRLADRVLDNDTPASRPDREELATWLGAELVRRDNGWVLDSGPDSAAARAGLQRGDLIVSAWPDRRAMRVIVHRRGEGYLDVTVTR